MHKLLISTIVLLGLLYGESDTGCSVANILKNTNDNLLNTHTQSNCANEQASTITAITLTLKSLKVLHNNEKVTIQREVKSKNLTCPPFCIEPMQIQDVVTVSEVEVLAFIDKLKEKKARLLIDVRKNSLYEEGTIPGAINLPLSMLADDSKYQTKVLMLLGAKKKHSKWFFKQAQSLLIFGTSSITDNASSAIKKLLALGYPSDKLLYYRGGINAWKALGLTVY